VLLSVGLAVCASGARADEPKSVDSARDPVLPDAAAPSIAEPEDSAASLGDIPTISLADAVATALTQNFGIQSAADAVQVAQFGESAGRAQFFPQLTPSWQRSVSTTTAAETRSAALAASQRVPWTGGTLSATGTLSSISPTADPTLPVASLLAPRTADFRLSLSQPLLRGFGPNATFFDLTNRRRAREGQERSFVLSRQLLAEQVVDAFYGVTRQRRLLAVARQSLKRNRDLLRASEARMQAGVASKLDVLRADLQVSLAQDSMVASEAALQTSLEGFRVLLGMRATEELQPAEVTLNEEPTLDLPPTEVLVARALEGRVDIHETQDRVADARRYAALAQQNLLPQVDLNVGVTQFGAGTTYRESLRSLDRRVDVFLSTSYPLQRSDDRAQRATALVAVAGSERGLSQRRLEVEAEVRASVRDLERVVKSIELQKKSLALAEQKHRLATIRYQRGLDSNFNVVEAEGEVVTTRATLVSLLTQLEVGRIHLLRVTGELDVEREFAK
jgi:outer membrane protein TolC